MSIKKGDRLILTQGGFNIPVEAASDEKDGLVVIKQRGTFANCSTADLTADTRPDVGAGAVAITGDQPDVSAIRNPCPTCGVAGTFVPPNWVDTVRRMLMVRFRCQNNHTWIEEFPLK